MAIPPISQYSDLTYISRTDWQALAPAFDMEKHQPQFITIHHTASLQTDKPISDKLLALQRFSISTAPLADGSAKKAWADIPYHFYIDHIGSIAEGREMMYVGDSNTDYDLRGHILIVLEGNFELEKVTPQQYESLEKIILVLSKKWKISAESISGHKDQTNTSCPGEDLYRLLPQLRTRLTQS